MNEKEIKRDLLKILEKHEDVDYGFDGEDEIAVPCYNFYDAADEIYDYIMIYFVEK